MTILSSPVSPSGNTGLLSLSTGKTEELILRKLQDISTKQKNMDVMFKGKRRGASSAPSSSVLPNKAISPSSNQQTKPKSLAPGLRLKVVPTPVPHSIPPQPAPQQPKTSPIISPPSRKPPSRCRSPGERTRPNILSRRKPQPPLGKAPVPLTLLLSSCIKWARLTADLETELPCEEIKHCQSFGFVFLPPQQIPHLFMLGFSLLKCCL